ncbi:MAG TPA: CFI-box-CTERM domain-containing protein [Dehalococcoidia bacterium]|nr:CFI-box-CTERM domain-containing protein [Dehalococcoidia bacterium]
MKARIVYVALALVLVLSLAAAVAVSVVSAQSPVDYVDIGDTTSEAGHNLQGWGPIEPATSGGGYGGIDDCRCTVNGSECSNPELFWGSLTLDTGTGMTATELLLSVLDGSGNDSFEVYVNSHLVKTYTDPDPIIDPETWYTHNISISDLNLSGSITVKVDCTASAWSGCPTYGQLAVDWAELYAETTPEGEGPCFIATAAYGTASASEIDVLRAFRDEVLLESKVGSQLVEWYYQTSPPVADFISEHEGLRTLVRELLVDPVASLVEATEVLWGD